MSLGRVGRLCSGVVRMLVGWSISNSVVGLCTYIQLGEGCVDLSGPSVLSFARLKRVNGGSVLLFTLLWTTDTWWTSVLSLLLLVVTSGSVRVVGLLSLRSAELLLSLIPTTSLLSIASSLLNAGPHPIELPVIFITTPNGGKGVVDTRRFDT